MTYEIINKLKDKYQELEFSNNNFPNLINKDYLKGDNEKHMKMYDWMSRVYDFSETVGENLCMVIR